ncbi:MAG: hypothetical protein M9894_16190 [Planctomycetes bacterium]|nr:hypothetical protein [Planctomycetota bacterium]
MTLAPGAPREAKSRPTAYVSARFSEAEQSCQIVLRYTLNGQFAGISDPVTMTGIATPEDGHVARDEPFDLACDSYSIVVLEPPASGEVTFVVREVGP